MTLAKAQLKAFEFEMVFNFPLKQIKFGQIQKVCSEQF